MVNNNEIEEFWNDVEDKFFSRFEEGESEFNESDVEEFFEKLGINCKYCDSGIDDGINDDDCEDTYLMYYSFDVSKDGIDHHIIFYYGDSTRLIGCIDWR